MELATVITSAAPTLNASTTLADLAAAIGIPEALLVHRAFHATRSLLYTYSTVPKRDGTTRDIQSPHWQLAFMQRRIAGLLEEIYRPSSRAHGFVKDRGIRTNAMCHVGKRLFLNIDLSDFFPSITLLRIRGRLMAAPYGLSNQVATAIARLCTLNDVLPIGAPSSPILANMICSKLDYDLTVLARERGCFYTRYADDITISTQKRRFPADLVDLPAGQRSGFGTAGKELESVVQANGFVINPRKTRVLSTSDSQEVCGIVCNEKLNVSRKLMRQTRGMIHAWRKFGLVDASNVWKQAHNWRGAQSFERSLRGRLEHMIHIRGEDDSVVNSLVNQFNALPGRTYKTLFYAFRGGWKDNLHKTVCVIESGDDVAVEYKQGSGFLIRNGFIITNSHNIVIAGTVAPDLIARFPNHLGIDIELEVVIHDSARDFAILQPKDPTWKLALSSSHLEVSFKRSLRDEVIYLAGFPAYTDGDHVHRDVGQVVGLRTEQGISYLRVSIPIVKGNSGGPVIDANGRVVGIATKGIDTEDVPNVLRNGSLQLSDFTAEIAPLLV